MSRTISSSQTFLLKLGFVPFMFVSSGIAAIESFLSVHPGNPTDPLQSKWLYLALWIFGSLFFYRMLGRLKRVVLDGADLRISNFRREIVVPLRDVEEITENRGGHGRTVTLRLRKRTEFGDSVVFMPRMRAFPLFWSHPIVAELRAAADRARGGLP